MKQLARGYTVVELMMSLAVFATGVTGVIAMERATVGSNQDARNVAIANDIAETWLSQLATDATLWSPGWNVTQTTWLSTITGNDGNWQLPTYNLTRAFGAQFDGFGAPTAANGSFCAQIRLTWVFGDGVVQPAPVTGNGMIRTEVRVFWPRDMSAAGSQTASADEATSFATACTSNAPGDVNNVTTALQSGATYHVVMHAGAVREQTQP